MAKSWLVVNSLAHGSHHTSGRECRPCRHLARGSFGTSQWQVERDLIEDRSVSLQHPRKLDLLLRRESIFLAFDGRQQRRQSLLPRDAQTCPASRMSSHVMIVAHSRGRSHPIATSSPPRPSCRTPAAEPRFPRQPARRSGRRRPRPSCRRSAPSSERPACCPSCRASGS